MRWRKVREQRRTLRDWQWAFQPSNSEAYLIGADQVAGYREMIEKRRAEGKPYGSIWKRRVSYAPWRSA